MRQRSATFLKLFARHTQSDPREGLQPELTDREFTPLTDTIRTVVEPSQRALILLEQHTSIVGQRHLVFALERLGASVSLIIARTITGVAE